MLQWVILTMVIYMESAGGDDHQFLLLTQDCFFSLNMSWNQPEVGMCWI